MRWSWLLFTASVQAAGALLTLSSCLGITFLALYHENLSVELEVGVTGVWVSIWMVLLSIVGILTQKTTSATIAGIYAVSQCLALIIQLAMIIFGCVGAMSMHFGRRRMPPEQMLAFTVLSIVGAGVQFFNGFCILPAAFYKMCYTRFNARVAVKEKPPVVQTETPVATST